MTDDPDRGSAFLQTCAYTLVAVLTAVLAMPAWEQTKEQNGNKKRCEGLLSRCS